MGSSTVWPVTKERFKESDLCVPGPSMGILPLTTTWGVEGGTLISPSRQRGKLRLTEVKSSGKGHTESNELSLQWNQLCLIPEAKLFNRHPQSPALLHTQTGTMCVHGQAAAWDMAGLASQLPGCSLASSVWRGPALLCASCSGTHGPGLIKSINRKGPG